MLTSDEYEEVYESFDWESVLETYDWDAPEELNMAHEAVDRHAGSGNVGFAWVSEEGKLSEYTFTELRDASNRVANALAELGIERGDRITTLLPKIPETIITVLGIWKTGAIHVPLFTAFEKQAVEFRVNDCDPELLLYHTDHDDTVTSLDIETELDVISVGDGDNEASDYAYDSLVDGQSTEYDVVRTSMDEAAAMQYTSGTTGPPKGVVMSHKVLPILYPHTKYAMDVTEDDLVWGAADPSWSYGLFTAGFAPMALGATRLLHSGQFDAEHWVRILDEHDVTVMGAAPSAYRGIIAAGDDVLEGHSFESLRVLSSAGEPLNPEVYNWFEDNLGLKVHDTYGLTEAGMIVNNYAGLDMETKAGSMGRPSPGYEVELLDPETREPVGTDEIGEVAAKPREWVLMDEYWEMPQKTEDAFYDGWLLTDDLARKDEDGYFWYEGRSDDVIISSGYRIGPFEVESSLIEHPTVAEAAAIGVPDDQRGQIVKAFVVPVETPDDPEATLEDLQSHVKDGLARHAYPREIEFVDELPTTATGKIQRYKLEERERD
ncbi:acyl-CoA synthetase [Natronorubrum tibetense]|uniref:AMP-dependent synthetase and ligase n=1 Tax=Natronorubrum tibetense GA33 TaxID=1114856 RepID=L9VKS4_9EURY|nr:AMP-binding protein [Natronorubrum tibetense]ELY37749.1 AMP-dependent synthetase and ligase [Natronorubrum tibetense GA33]